MSESIREIVERFFVATGDGERDQRCVDRIVEALEEREGDLEEQIDACNRLLELTKDDRSLVDVNFELLGERDEARALAVRAARGMGAAIADPKKNPTPFWDGRVAAEVILSKPWGKP